MRRVWTHFRLSPRRAGAVAMLTLVAACGGSGDALDLAALEREPILTVPVAGTANPRTVDSSGGHRPAITVLADVTGDWGDVSVSLAQAVRREGWTITSVDCVGTGNDVIARKLIAGTWVLLESGAGTRGAGVILRVDPDQGDSPPVVASGRCPAALVDAARP